MVSLGGGGDGIRIEGFSYGDPAEGVLVAGRSHWFQVSSSAIEIA